MIKAYVEGVGSTLKAAFTAVPLTKRSERLAFASITKYKEQGDVLRTVAAGLGETTAWTGLGAAVLGLTESLLTNGGDFHLGTVVGGVTMGALSLLATGVGAVEAARNSKSSK